MLDEAIASAVDQEWRQQELRSDEVFPRELISLAQLVALNQIEAHLPPWRTAAAFVLKRCSDIEVEDRGGLFLLRDGLRAEPLRPGNRYWREHTPQELYEALLRVVDRCDYSEFASGPAHELAVTVADAADLLGVDRLSGWMESAKFAEACAELARARMRFRPASVQARPGDAAATEPSAPPQPAVPPPKPAHLHVVTADSPAPSAVEQAAATSSDPAVYLGLPRERWKAGGRWTNEFCAAVQRENGRRGGRSMVRISADVGIARASLEEALNRFDKRQEKERNWKAPTSTVNGTTG